MDLQLTGVALGLLLGAAKVGLIGTVAFGIGWWRAHRRLQRLDATLPDPAELQDRLGRLEELADYTASQLARVIDAQDELRRLLANPPGRGQLQDPGRALADLPDPGRPITPR